MHFLSGKPMHFYSGVDTLPLDDLKLPVQDEKKAL
jgi:hypothetical protein